MVDPQRETDVVSGYSYRQHIARADCRWRLPHRTGLPPRLKPRQPPDTLPIIRRLDRKVQDVRVPAVGFVGDAEGKPQGTRGARVLGPPTLSGSSLALLFWWQSLTPTLIPRSWEVQATIGAVCLAVGYGIGALIGHCARRLPERLSRSRVDAIRQHSWIVLGAAWLIGVFLGAVLWMGWQNEQRHFMGMASIGSLDAVLMGTLSLPLGALFVLIGRVTTNGVGATHRFIQRHVPGAVAVLATAVLIVALSIVLGRAVALPALTAL